ncbi:MAG: helix-turn-helix transcriptional regulator [Clostridiales bacterium]|jgi:transcriptional regulator with XRE-family HTH domain|nr:helix-turn-helix transcriptional regulator [Clostridiales bacterium]
MKFKKIRELRIDKDISQKEIADYLHCDQSLYSKYERGERSIPIEFVIKLAKYYNVTLEYILQVSDEDE